MWQQCSRAGGCGGKASKGEGGSIGACLGLACPPGTGPVKGGSEGTGGVGGDGENNLPPYVPPATDANGIVPTPDPDDPQGYAVDTGTFNLGATGESPNSTQAEASNKTVPTASAGQPPSHEIQWWRQDYQDDSQPPAWAYSIRVYYGYDGDVAKSCNNNPSWSVFDDDALYAGIPDTIERVLVYKEWCRFSKSDMKLHCPRWADATCFDITQTMRGTCEISTTLNQ